MRFSFMNRLIGSFSLRRTFGFLLLAASAGPTLFPARLEAQNVPKPAASPKDEVKASHILLSSKEEADAIRKEIVAEGGDRKAFTAAARKNSKDVTTKLLGGDVGWFRSAGQMDKGFSDVAFGLKVGEISEPVKTEFGWHLILVTDRRDPATAQPPAVPPTDAAATPKPAEEAASTAPAATPNPAAATTAATTPAAPGTTAAPAATPAVAVEAKRTPRSEQANFRLSIETVGSQALRAQQFTFAPEQAVEFNLVLKNESSKEQKFVARELLPLGLKVTPLGETVALPGDFQSIPEPAAYFVAVKPYEILGIEVSLNDYFKGLGKKRYAITWDITTLLATLEARFAKAKESPDWIVFSEAAKKRFPLQVDVVQRDLSPRIVYQRSRPLTVSIAEPLKAEGKYYARFKLSGSEEPLVIELYNQKQFAGARYFASLITEGFYDGLDFFDSQPGDYVLGGCPTRTGTGAPTSQLPMMRNDAKLEHKKGTVSLVSRAVRSKGPVPGGQVGSIFVVCLKPHPEWNDEHVPVGEVVAGLDQLEKPGTRIFREVTLLSEAEYKEAGGTPAATQTPAQSQLLGNPEAVIKTSKGALTVELFEDAARNTVANFVTLVGDKFYDKLTKGEGKQKIFVVNDGGGKPLLAQTGSPTNELDPSSGPGYSIPSEVNTRKHSRGALAMVVAYDETNKLYIPDTSGSQFFICLQDVSYYDYLKSFTVFGQVTSGMEILDKLTEGDTIESIEITKKKTHPYNFRKVSNP